jgi:hypothetical protein
MANDRLPACWLVARIWIGRLPIGVTSSTVQHADDLYDASWGVSANV